MMNDKDQKKVLTALAEFVAWSGEEDHFATCQRLLKAERLLRRVAPEILREIKAKVKASNAEAEESAHYE